MARKAGSIAPWQSFTLTNHQGTTQFTTFGSRLALNTWNVELGLEKWRDWSSRSKHYDEQEIENKWTGFTPDAGVTLGTLFALAKQAGWTPPQTSSSKRPASLDEMLADRSLIDTTLVGKLNIRGLMDFADLANDPASNILGNRWLVRNAAGVIFAPSGVGKSTTICQACAAWSLGLEDFGIKPAKPLKIAIFQAEDDDYDIKEITAGVRESAGYSKQDAEEITQNVRVVRSRMSGLSFLKEVMLPVLESSQTDLVIINPIMSFIGGGLSSQEVAQQAFRVEIGAVMETYQVAVLMIHHTGKIQNLDTSKLNRYQAQYLTFGSSDLVNMIRCQLMIWPTAVDGIFGFHALKRAEKIGWVKPSPEPAEADLGKGFQRQETVRYYSHHKTASGTSWVPADDAEIAAVKEAETKSKKRGKNGFPTKDKKLDGTALADMLAENTVYTTKKIVEAVVNHFQDEDSGDGTPSKPTIERSIREAVDLHLITPLCRGNYKKCASITTR